MLELQHIKKTYHVGDTETKALDDVSVAFREKEFVAVLGPSGSGKTTFLNIIGGLDRYDSGDLLIKGKHTSDFKDSDWDAYRNNSIGFVFQSYNLIGHLSIVANVELGMTLSGVPKEEKHRRALEVLEQVGLKDHLHKRPNQLSGGQMQRVAIARALANDPEILLCDEPTGALDTSTSVQIMDLIQKLSAERLVIMVTHNPQLAEDYADRIIRFQDGHIISDTHPHQERPKPDGFHLKKTKMRFLTALNLSFNNIRTKKGRTFLTAFASSIGIIGIAVILSLSSGFRTTIDDFQTDAMAQFPIVISRQSAEVDMAAMMEQHTQMLEDQDEEAPPEEIILTDPDSTIKMHTNRFTGEYLQYLKNIDPKICSSIGYTRIVSMNMVRKTDSGIIPVSFSSESKDEDGQESSAMSGTMSAIGLSSFPEQLDQEETSYLEKNYDLLAGQYPAAATDLVLVLDSDNTLNKNILENLGFDTEGKESFDFNDLIGAEFKIVSNNDFYSETPYGNYLPTQDYEAMYNSDSGITVRIAGIVRVKENAGIGILNTGIAYSDALSEQVAAMQQESDIVKAQQESSKNVMTMEEISEADKDSLLAVLGGDTTPYAIMLYPATFEQKDQVIQYLDDWNEGKSTDDAVVYTDMVETISSMTGDIMDGITVVLVAFAAISLVVSMIMICIIIYTSVLERTKEIGILRSLGARKKDITHVFDAETFILGLCSGLLGVAIAWLLTFPINSIIASMASLENVAHLQPLHALILVAISTILTMLGGHIPARMASRKDAVEALRSE
ncbi:sulfate ABC transporter ATP-binding protein [Hydrogeniiclostridium mannosilyticum]|uniref:Sulfate ABC transporter ATP-binding protein n=1 Tax=Hydrogeniiclostridium mannosilyticum TaxID=2764322 RepID=A0A328UHK6_9FIRM|nr:ABC transporter ATP-binding protein/permease [Hydrogeniiclostridium mannosilyticum]RAQ30709.1 sulfate ABC transporter ATP-binding protein [Hydrogeniiclostridium mannosilyticum]